MEAIDPDALVPVPLALGGAYPSAIDQSNYFVV